MIRVDRVAAGEKASAWASALSAIDVAASRVIKQSGLDSVRRGTLLGRDVIVKISACRTLGQRLKRSVGLSRAHRHWRGAAWLTAHGVATGRPLALAWDTDTNPLRQLLVIERVPGLTVLERLASPSTGVREQHALATAVGELTAQLLNAGRYNRDHKPSNLIVEDLSKGAAGVAVIDCVALRRCSRANRLAARWMLKTLIVEPHGCGCPPRRTLMMRGLLACLRGLELPNAATRKERRWMWTHVADAFFAHGDPRPAVDPLKQAS